MTLIRSTLEPQPDFPKVDVSDDNVEMLELLLMNESLVVSGHVEGERTSWLFRVGHPAIVRAGTRLDYADQHQIALDHGVATYEAMSSLLTAVPTDVDMFAVNANGAALVQGVNEHNLRRYIDDAYDSFIDEMPRAAGVVGRSSERFVRRFSNYAILGAAMARQFELDGVE